ncbi:hypothetical protein QJQ45_011287 [Haematococcus lacustris]|nr:hypothetical protein QJQ45_011287 [Haematococcus lacustris]
MLAWVGCQGRAAGLPQGGGEANSGKDRLPGKVATVDELRTSRVSSAMNSPQPCEEELDRSKPTRPEGRNDLCDQLGASVASQRCSLEPVRGFMWCPKLDQATPGDIGRCVDNDCNSAGRRGPMVPNGAVLVAMPDKGTGPGQKVPSNGLQGAAGSSTQGPGPAACGTVICALGIA